MSSFCQNGKNFHICTTPIESIFFFELSPVRDFKGDEVDQEMKLTFKKVGEQIPLRVTTAPKFSEMSTNDYENNLGSRCFHRSMRNH